jgi:hypothetical protein
VMAIVHMDLWSRWTNKNVSHLVLINTRSPHLLPQFLCWWQSEKEKGELWGDPISIILCAWPKFLSAVVFIWRNKMKEHNKKTINIQSLINLHVYILWRILYLSILKNLIKNIQVWFMVFNALMLLSTIFSYIVAVSFIGGGNRSTRRKPLTCHKSMTNFIT